MRDAHMQWPQYINLYNDSTAGVDNIDSTLQEADDVFMTANLNYNTTHKVRNSDVLDPKEPMKYVSAN